MSIELDKLGTGSIVEDAMGGLFTKDVYGDWWKLSISLGSSPVKKLDYIEAGTVIRKVEKGPLDAFEVGDIISFESDYGRRIALKHRFDFWSVIGIAGEKTTAEMVETFSPHSVRKVGFSDGRG